MNIMNTFRNERKLSANASMTSTSRSYGTVNMFESDDFDQVLSQFDFPEVTSNTPSKTRAENVQAESNDHIANLHNKTTAANGSNTSPKPLQTVIINTIQISHKLNTRKKTDEIPIVSNIGVKRAIISKDDHFGVPKHPKCNIIDKHIDNQIKRKTDEIPMECNFGDKDKHDSTSKKIEFVAPKLQKHNIIDKHFDNQIKRRFPGPAGILRGPLEESKKKNETIGHIELLSQDIKYTENEHREFFESPLWIRLLEDIKSWKISNIETIKTIKEQVIAGGSQRRKAQTVTAFVETVDHRSDLDPYISLRDTTDNIKCTLHREVWSAFAPFIAAENCVLVLWKPTVLMIQRPLKKYYLNITLRNIHVIYSSANIKDEDHNLPNGYTKVQENNFTIIKTENPLPNFSDVSEMWSNEDADDSISDKDLASIFSDDLF